MSVGEPIFAFKDFVKSLHKRNVNKTIRSFASRKAADADIESMRQYLVRFYRKTTAVHSFIDENGQIWDCVPDDLQPGVRGKKKIDLDMPEFPGPPVAASRNLTPDELFDSGSDKFGNERLAPLGTIPIRRLTLEDFARYDSLQSYHRKNGPAFSDFDNERKMGIQSSGVHKYANGKQLVSNRGTEATFSIWQPRMMNGSHIFSLSQMWVINGQHEGTQVVEVGWIVYPEKFNTNQPVFFVYWTPDNYQTGNFNQEEDSFVLKDPRWRLGAPINSVSQIGGLQIELRFSWFLSGNKWNLYGNGNRIGFYPVTLFKGGALTNFSDAVLVGGEVCGNTSLPPMGSSRLAQEGLNQAAYVRNITFFDMAGSPREANLQGSVTSSCYSYQAAGLPNWGAHFFFGGPGGNQCL